MIYFTTWKTLPTFYNYKWNITFKNCESLYCTPVTYLYINYTSIKNKIKFKKVNQTKNF